MRLAGATSPQSTVPKSYNSRSIPSPPHTLASQQPLIEGMTRPIPSFRSSQRSMTASTSLCKFDDAEEDPTEFPPTSADLSNSTKFILPEFSNETHQQQREETPENSPVPPSPSSFLESATMASISCASDWSPSPSIASVRVAQLVKRAPPARNLPRFPASLDSDVKDYTALEENEVTEEQESSQPRTVAARKSSRDLVCTSSESTPTGSNQTSPKKTLAIQSRTCAVHVKPTSTADRLPTSESNDSVASWQSGLETGAMAEFEPSSRMKSFLGPKMKIISPAPWNDDEMAETDLQKDISPSRPSIDGASVSKTPKSVISKPNFRTKSFSALTSRKGSSSSTATTINAAIPQMHTEEALSGLGLGPLTSPSVLLRKTSEPSELKSATFPRTHPSMPAVAAHKTETKSLPKSFQTSFNARQNSTNARNPIPIAFEKNSGYPAGLSVKTKNEAPKSAPAQIVSFSTATGRKFNRSESNSSLSVGVVPNSMPNSNSSLSIATSHQTNLSSSPTTPISNLPALLESTSSPTSPTSYFPASPAATGGPNGSSGYKLISLDEARKRESDRIATAAAKQRQAEDVLNNSLEAARTRESTSESNSGKPVSAGATAKTLKTKKSGFLKRMMGASTEKAQSAHAVPELPNAQSGSNGSPRGIQPELPPTNSGTQTQTGSPHKNPTALSVFISASSPASSVDLGRGMTSSIPSTGLLQRSTSTVLPTATNKISFASTPKPDESLRLNSRKGLAPSLSLRPISMAFSKQFEFIETEPSDGSYAEDDGEDIPLNKLIGYTKGNSSPLAPSFLSTTTTSGATASPLFEDLASPKSDTGSTPTTPGFPHSTQSSPYPTTLSPSAFAEDYNRERKLWVTEKFELETKLKTLRQELISIRLANNEIFTCQHCGERNTLESSPAGKNESVVQRPRFPGHSGTGTFYSHGQTA